MQSPTEIEMQQRSCQQAGCLDSRIERDFACLLNPMFRTLKRYRVNSFPSTWEICFHEGRIFTTMESVRAMVRAGMRSFSLAPGLH